MPLIQQPVAFPSINFLPGFPSLSKFDCNPWSTNFQAGACGNQPVDISRQKGTAPAAVAIRRALVAAGAGTGADQFGMRRGIVPAALAGSGGSLIGVNEGYRDVGGIGFIDRLHDRFDPNYDAEFGGFRGLSGCGGGCGCGGSCGCGDDHGGLGDLTADFNAAMADPVTWAKASILPLAVGALIGYMLHRK